MHESNGSSLTADALEARYPESAGLQLDDISFSLVPGELVAVVGPNGSGKTTLVRALSRTLAPERGQVLLDSNDLYAYLTQQDSARFIAVVPQSADMFLDFTVRDIVAMGRAPLQRGRSGIWLSDTPEDQAAVDSTLARMGISDDLASRPISQVSGGERQRALIARMLAQEAKFLLLDEPTAALDVRNQGALLSWLRRLAANEQRSVMVVLHDLNLAAELADRIVVMSRGKIEAIGSPNDVLTSTLINNVYGVRAWVRSNPATGRPAIFPLMPDDLDNPAPRPLAGVRVHLFCGMGTGARLMFELTALGATVTACVLHEGDVDHEAATFLNIPHAIAPAFSRPTEDAIRKAEKLADSAGVAILTDVPIGEINQDVAEGVRRFEESGRGVESIGGAYCTREQVGATKDLLIKLTVGWHK